MIDAEEKLYRNGNDVHEDPLLYSMFAGFSLRH